MGRFAERRRGTEGTGQVLEHHVLPRYSADRVAFNFVRGVDSYLAEAMLMTEYTRKNQIIITRMRNVLKKIEGKISRQNI